MQLSRTTDLNPMVRCPYDKAHTVSLSRIQIHLVKCEKRYPKLEICPYNATHRFPKNEIKDHVINCPARAALFPIEEINKKPVSGFIHTPKPYMVSQYISKNDPDHEAWDD